MSQTICPECGSKHIRHNASVDVFADDFMPFGCNDCYHEFGSQEEADKSRKPRANLPENLKLCEYCIELIDDEIKHIRSNLIVRNTKEEWAKVADLLFQAAELLDLTVIENYD